MKKAIFLLFISLFTIGCSTSIKTTLADKSLTALSPETNIIVIIPEEPAPASSRVFGKAIPDLRLTADTIP